MIAASLACAAPYKPNIESAEHSRSVANLSRLSFWRLRHEL